MTRAEHSQRARENGPERVVPATINIGGTDLPCSRSGITREKTLGAGGFDPSRFTRVSLRRDVYPERPAENLTVTIDGQRFTVATVTSPPHASCWELDCEIIGKRG